jgi:predicted dehydrogenase
MNISRRAILAAPTALVFSQDSKKLRLAVIGAGHRAWAHLQVLKGIPDFEVVALADPTPEFLNRAVTIAGGGVHTYPEFADMLAKEKDLDGVVVITPNFLHADATVAALSAGLHVLCEKPMATTVQDANRMLAASEKSGKQLQIGLQMRYDPLYEKMAEVVKSGAIGTLRYVSGNLFRGDWNPASWKYRDPTTGISTNWRFLSFTAGSSLMEDGIHELDVLNWMIAEPIRRVYASGGNNVLTARETIDHADVVVDYANGTKVGFEFCIFSPGAGPAARRMTLIGTEGNLQMESNKLTLRKKGAGATQIEVQDRPPDFLGGPALGPDPDIGTYREYIAFAKSIRTGDRPFCSGDTAKQVLKIALLAEKSLRSGKIMSWTDVPA